jgi:hypothetical protein
MLLVPSANAFSFAGYSAVDVVPIPGQGRIKIRGFTEAKVKYDGYYTRLFDSNLEYIGKYGQPKRQRRYLPSDAID